MPGCRADDRAGLKDEGQTRSFLDIHKFARISGEVRNIIVYLIFTDHVRQKKRFRSGRRRIFNKTQKTSLSTDDLNNLRPNFKPNLSKNPKFLKKLLPPAFNLTYFLKLCLLLSNLLSESFIY